MNLDRMIMSNKYQVYQQSICNIFLHNAERAQEKYKKLSINQKSYIFSKNQVFFPISFESLLDLDL